MNNVGALHRIPGSQVHRARLQIGEIFVHQRRAVAHGLLGGEHRRQFFILDIDQRQRFFRRVLIDRRHGGDRLADKAHLFDRKNMLVFDGVAVAARRHIFSRNNRLHAGMFFCFFHIDAQNFSVRNRAAKNFSPQHPRQLDVRPVDRLPGEHLRAIDSLHRFSDHPIVSHLASSLLPLKIISSRRRTDFVNSFSVYSSGFVANSIHVKDFSIELNQSAHVRITLLLKGDALVTFEKPRRIRFDIFSERNAFHFLHGELSFPRKQKIDESSRAPKNRDGPAPWQPS